jgi:hypothetical protein
VIKMKKVFWILLAPVILAGCFTGAIRTEEDWRMAETRIESLGRIAGLLAADRVREGDGLASEAGIRLARIGRALNDAAEQLAMDRPPEGAKRDLVEEFIDEAFHLSLEQRLAVTEGFAVAQELAEEIEISSRARLWLAHFCRSASRSILEVYEHEFIDGRDHGDRAGDTLGDS